MNNNTQNNTTINAKIQYELTPNAVKLNILKGDFSGATKIAEGNLTSTDLISLEDFGIKDEILYRRIYTSLDSEKSFDELIEFIRTSDLARKEREQKQKTEREEVELEKKAKIERENKTKANWVNVYGDVSQKERFAAGMLCEKEILEGMANTVFTALDATFPLYTTLKSSEAPCKCDYDSCGFECDTNILHCVDDEDWQVIKRIKAIETDAEVVVKLHWLERDRCKSEVQKVGFEVKLKVDDFTFSREYQAK